MSAAVAEVVHAVKSTTWLLDRPKRAWCGFRFARGTRTSDAPVTCKKCLKRTRR